MKAYREENCGYETETWVRLHGFIARGAQPPSHNGKKIDGSLQGAESFLCVIVVITQGNIR